MCPRRRSCSKFPFELLNRREWIKLFVFGAATNLALGKAPKRKAGTAKPALAAPSAVKNQPVLADISPSNNLACVVPIRLSSFPVLQSIGGSLQIWFSNYINPFIVTRADPDVFYVLDSTCGHQSSPVDPYVAGNERMICPNHFSEYDIQGRVTLGPSAFDLVPLRSEFDGSDTVQVQIEGVPLRVNSVRPLSSPLAANTRLELKFPATQGCRYRVRYYADAGALPQVVNFAVTISGTADQTSMLVPRGFSSTKTIYVDAPGVRGYFAIEMVLSPDAPF